MANLGQTHHMANSPVIECQIFIEFQKNYFKMFFGGFELFSMSNLQKKKVYQNYSWGTV